MSFGRMGSRFALALLVVACHAPRPPAELVKAERLEREGRDVEALAAFQAAQVSCDRAPDRLSHGEWCAAALLGHASALERLGRTSEALAAYEAVPDRAKAASAAVANALVRAGRLALGLGRAPRGYELLWTAVANYPESGAAEDALRVIVADGRRRDARALFDALAELRPRLEGAAIADNLLYEMAGLARSELGDRAAALRLLDDIVALGPEGALFDDALWEGARLARATGDSQGAVRRLRRLLATRERAFIVGSYDSPWLDDAQLELGLVLRDELGRAREALAELAALASRHPRSLLLDDAAWEEAVTWERLGDTAAACRALDRLALRHSESKYEVEKAPAMRARLGCGPR